MQKNKLLYFLYINAFILISIFLPSIYNPIFLLNNFSINIIFGDLVTVLFWIFTFLSFSALYFRKDKIIKYFFIVFIIFLLLYQLYFLFLYKKEVLDIKGSAVNSVHSVNVFVKDSLLKNLPFLNHDGIKNNVYTMINLDSVGLLNSILTIITFGTLSIKLSFIFVSGLLIILIITLIFILIKNRVNSFKYTKIHSGNITVYLMESYNLNDLSEVPKYDKWTKQGKPVKKTKRK